MVGSGDAERLGCSSTIIKLELLEPEPRRSIGSARTGEYDVRCGGLVISRSLQQEYMLHVGFTVVLQLQ